MKVTESVMMIFPKGVGGGVRAGVVTAMVCFAAGAAWGAGSNNDKSVPTNEQNKNPDEVSNVFDPVSPVNGAVSMKQTDVAVPCPGVSLTFARNYLSNRDSDAGAALGSGWRHNWEWRLEAEFRVQHFVADYLWMKEHGSALFKERTGAGTLNQVADLILNPGDVVMVGDRLLRYVGKTEQSGGVGTVVVTDGGTVQGTGEGTVLVATYQFEVESGERAKAFSPDGVTYVFPKTGRSGGYFWASNGNFRATPECLGLSQYSGVVFFAPPSDEMMALGQFVEDLLSGGDYQYTTFVSRETSGVIVGGDGTRCAFESGALASISAAGGERVSVTRDSAGRITRLSHSNGLQLSLSYADARLVRVDTPSAALCMTYAYDGSGCLTGAVRHTSSGAGGDTYLYAAGGHSLTNRTNAAGREYRYVYQPCMPGGGAGTACTFSELTGGYYRGGLEFGTNGNWSVVTEWLSGERFRRRRFEWDENGHVTQIATQPQDPGAAGALSVYSRTDAGDFSGETHTSASGDYLSVRRLYDGRYNVTNEAAAINREPSPTEGVSAVWHPFYSLPLRIADADGVTADFDYDDNGRLLLAASYPSVDSPAVSSLAWEGSRPVSVTDPCGRVTTLTYDALGRLSGVVPAVGPGVGFESDILGHVRRIVQPAADTATNRVTLVDSDEAGRNRTVTYPDGLSEILLHDSCGNPTSHVSRAGRRTDATWLPAAHAGSFTRWLDAATPATVSYDYDLLFNTLAVTDPMGQTVERYVLDDEGRVTAVTNLEGQVFSAAYGAGGIPLSMTRFDGVAVSNVWDCLGNFLGVLHTAPDAAGWVPVAGFAYNAAGRMLAASNAVSRLAWAYDGAGGITNETLAAVGGESPALSVGWAYDASGLLTNTVVSGAGHLETLSYSAAYDPGARLLSLGTLAGEFRYSYCGWNGAVATASNAALTVEYAYDMLDRVTNIVYRAADGSLVRSFSYGLDPDGLITQKVSVSAGGAAVTNAYAYDGLGRLVSADGVSYTYDLAGNRLSQSGAGGTPVFSTYTHNRLDGDGYDAAGNTTSMVRNGVTLTLTWNTQGQLVSVSTNGAFAESYLYDVVGRRVATTDNGGTVYHVYDGDECVADVDGSGRPLLAYTWGPGIDNLLAVAVFSSGATNTYYAVKDHLGSVQALVDTQGQIVESYTYDAWGNVQSALGKGQSVIGNRYLWQGREYSAATGLYNFRARWYDPVTGLWLSKDPIGISSGLNQYLFCANNPINVVDPYGLSGTLTIISSRGNNQVSSVGFGNHALIVYQPDDSDITYTWGTWGREDIGVVGLKENFQGDRNYLGEKCASRRSKYIDDTQEMILGKMLSKYSRKGNGAWSKWSPCSSFAANVWESVTGEDLADRHLGGLGYSDPNVLAGSIDQANRAGRKWVQP